VIGRYGTLTAFREALEAHLANASQRDGVDLQRLRRRVAFDRLLARLFHADDPPWLLKGGYALELRMPRRARSTLDLDVMVKDPAGLVVVSTPEVSVIEAAYDRLQQAADADLGDGFRFLIRRPRKQRDRPPWGGARCNVDARLAGRSFVRFRLDLGLGDPVLGLPDWVEGSNLLEFAGIPAPRVALCPAAQQLAEKVHAFSYPWQDRDNTRVKDLVDLVLLVDSGLLDPESVRCSLRATFETRSTHPLPPRLPQPPADWEEPFSALARDVGLPVETVEAALDLLGARWEEWWAGE